MEMEMIYRLSMLVGFLLAGFIALLIGALIVGLRHCCKAAAKELEAMIDELETEEKRCLDESQNP